MFSEEIYRILIVYMPQELIQLIIEVFCQHTTNDEELFNWMSVIPEMELCKYTTAGNKEGIRYRSIYTDKVSGRQYTSQCVYKYDSRNNNSFSFSYPTCISSAYNSQYP